MDLQQVVHNAVQLPLDVYLYSPSQGKPVQTEHMADIAKYRFYSSDPLAVYGPTGLRIYFPFHPGGERFFLGLGPANQIIYRSAFRTIRVAQAIRTKMAGDTAAFRPLVTHVHPPVMIDVVTVAVHDVYRQPKQPRHIPVWSRETSSSWRCHCP